MPVTDTTSQANENAWRLDGLRWVIEMEHHNLKQTFSVNLLQLYANIGRIINNLVEKESADTDDNLITQANNLTARYGDIFKPERLKQMMLLARQYQPNKPDQDRDLLCFNWDYLALLLPIADGKEQQFYMRATALKRWSLNELKEHIEADDYQNPRLFKRLKAQALRYPGSTGEKRKRLERQLSVWRLYGDLRNMPFANPFTEPALSGYRLLLQPPNDERQLTYQQFNEGIKADGLNSIALYILKFREQVNNDLNNLFNNFLLNLGYSLVMHDPTDDILLKFLKQLYGDFFNLDTFDTIKVYRSSVIDNDLQCQMNLRLTWPHIIHLLPLKSSQAQLFYAELAYEEDLSPTELQRRIESNWYEQFLTADDKQKVPAHTTAIKKKRREKEIQGNTVFLIEHIFVDANDLRPFHNNLNILQNPYFMQFMAAPID